MHWKFFTISVTNSEIETQALNQFCAQHRMISIEKQFVQNGIQSFWSFCICYQDPINTVTIPKKGKVDYRERLSEKDFAIFSMLRDLRKKIAEQESIPVYAIFTNEQLSEIVTHSVDSLQSLKSIEGIGPAKIEKYGADFLNALEHFKKIKPDKKGLPE